VRLHLALFPAGGPFLLCLYVNLSFCNRTIFNVTRMDDLRLQRSTNEKAHQTETNQGVTTQHKAMDDVQRVTE
jgi:hypothetical protein